MLNLMLPELEDLTAELERIKGSHNFDDSDFLDEDGQSTLQLTLGCSDQGYALQVGDNSYTGSAYGFPIWAVEYLTSESDCKSVAEDLLKGAIEQSST